MSADRRGGAIPRALRLMPGRQKACIKSASDRINPHHRDAGRARPGAAPQRHHALTFTCIKTHAPGTTRRRGGNCAARQRLPR